MSLKSVCTKCWIRTDLHFSQKHHYSMSLSFFFFLRDSSPLHENHRWQDWKVRDKDHKREWNVNWIATATRFHLRYESISEVVSPSKWIFSSIDSDNFPVEDVVSTLSICRFCLFISFFLCLWLRWMYTWTRAWKYWIACNFCFCGEKKTAGNSVIFKNVDQFQVLP